jgi:hypothetical protein
LTTPSIFGHHGAVYFDFAIVSVDPAGIGYPASVCSTCVERDHKIGRRIVWFSRFLYIREL